MRNKNKQPAGRLELRQTRWPTKAQPGSVHKIWVMQQRAHRGEAVFCDGDASMEKYGGTEEGRGAVLQMTPGGVLLFWCPGCENHHGIWTEQPNALGARWRWNGSFCFPTCSPSILIHADPKEKQQRCHLYVQAGKLKYLQDCGHKYRGLTVPMTPIDEV